MLESLLESRIFMFVFLPLNKSLSMHFSSFSVDEVDQVGRSGFELEGQIFCTSSGSQIQSVWRNVNP